MTRCWPFHRRHDRDDDRRRCEPYFHHHHHYVWFIVGDVAILLRADSETKLMSNLPLDKILTLGIEVVDSKGNVVTAATVSSATWTNSNPAAATDAPSADGLTDVLTPVGIGQTTTVSLSAVVGSNTFSATIDETVVAGSPAGVRITESLA